MRRTLIKHLLIVLPIVLFIFSCNKKQDQTDTKRKTETSKVTMVKFANTIVFVKDIEESKRFYSDILGLKVISNYEVLIIYENGFVIQQARSLYKTIYKKELEIPTKKQGRDNIDIYFECNNLEDIYDKLVKNNVKFIHPIERQSWGQYVMRFYDPDGHIVEIGNPMHLKFEE
jgi:catechol 2,3-dioxygenase-like lactoylglutathione lyase family enzyme